MFKPIRANSPTVPLKSRFKADSKPNPTVALESRLKCEQN